MSARTILVSGAGSGIGRACAIEVAKQFNDVEVVLLGRRLDALEETRREMPRTEKHQCVSVSQADRKGLSAAMQKLDLAKRNVVGVVANAGIGGENQYGEGDRWDDIIGTNLSGTYYFLSECVPALKAAKQKPVNVVIISSILARLGVGGYTAYCASKAGLLGMMRAFAQEHAQGGIYFNAICPGWVETDMAKLGIKGFASATGKDYDTALQSQLRMVPTRKMSEPREIASLAAYLMSNAQTSFTGQCFDINNGALMP